MAGTATATDMLKVIEILAESEKSWEDAAGQAVERASEIDSRNQIHLHQGHGSQSGGGENHAVPNKREHLVPVGRRIAHGNIRITRGQMRVQE